MSKFMLIISCFISLKAYSMGISQDSFGCSSLNETANYIALMYSVASGKHVKADTPIDYKKLFIHPKKILIVSGLKKILTRCGIDKSCGNEILRYSWGKQNFKPTSVDIAQKIFELTD
ncbi:MAG: hypothetical protein QF441_16195 [Bacteriovoracaceae bacterium]|jgi:hypothetical protein|nr:hypothetical protein [Bacteriovoracaceae bacterium]